jgi:hypothetical protein
MLEESSSLDFVLNNAPACAAACHSGSECQLPDSYIQQVNALNPDAGMLPSDGGKRALNCPTDPATLTVSCLELCLGRLTAGYVPPAHDDVDERGLGERLAAVAYLEAASVYAFARLERELRALGAPPALLRDARRARRDEVRHAAMTARLAKQRGARPTFPEALPPTAARSLFDVALENAVEGCVRETYGAVIGLVGASTVQDAELGRAMRSIAADECRHAELAWAVHAWLLPSLSADERRRVQCAMRAAVSEIAQRDPRAAELLFSTGPTAVAA